MINLLVDPLPKEYQGYLIRWQFWNGILISNCLSDTEHFDDSNRSKIEQLYTAFSLLYGKGVPPFEVAFEGLKWFLSCGKYQKGENTANKEIYFSFTDDHERLYSAFMVKYGINLNHTNDLHFFEFVALMNDLSKTAFRNIVDLRAMKKKDMKHFTTEQKMEIMKQKRKFALKQTLENQYTDKQKKAIDHFNKLVGVGQEV